MASDTSGTGADGAAGTTGRGPATSTAAGTGDAIATPAVSSARVAPPTPTSARDGAASQEDGSQDPATDGPAADLEFRPYDRHWEDFPEGTHLRTRGMTVTETHIVNWANLAGDWLPLHVDHHVSSQTPFRSVIAHGPLTLSLALGLVVQSGFFGDSVIAWLGLDEVRLPRPVLPGDTIYVHVTVIEQVTTSKPHRGRVTLSYEVVNQRDETVVTFRSGFLMHRRDRQAPADA